MGKKKNSFMAAGRAIRYIFFGFCHVDLGIGDGMRGVETSQMRDFSIPTSSHLRLVKMTKLPIAKTKKGCRFYPCRNCRQLNDSFYN